MNILSQYLRWHIVKAYLPVLGILLAVFSLLVLVEEIDEVGKGRYTFGGACEYLLLTIPSRVVFLAPFVALLGTIMGLGSLAQSRELVAMQASGISPYQIALSVLKVGAVFILIVAGMQEFVNPSLEQQAHFNRSLALSKSKAYQGKQGLWFQEGLRYVRIEEVLYGEIPRGIDIFEFNETGQMTTYLHAKEAEVEGPQRWILNDVGKKIIDGMSYSQEHLAILEWDSPLQQQDIQLLTLPRSSLAPSDLYRYIQILKRTGQNSVRYELAFWEKVIMPFNVGLMLLVAIPFAFGPLRMATVGKKFLFGALAGLTYYFFSEVLKHLGLLIGAAPFFTTITPFFALVVATGVFWRRYFY